MVQFTQQNINVMTGAITINCHQGEVMHCENLVLLCMSSLSTCKHYKSSSVRQAWSVRRTNILLMQCFLLAALDLSIKIKKESKQISVPIPSLYSVPNKVEYYSHHVVLPLNLEYHNEMNVCLPFATRMLPTGAWQMWNIRWAARKACRSSTFNWRQPVSL